MQVRRRWGTRGAACRSAAACTAIAAAACGPLAPPAAAELPHVVQPGETLWSIAAANNLTTRTVAVYNGLSEDAAVEAGQTLEVPTVAEGAAALAGAGGTASSDAGTVAPSGGSGSGGGAAHTVRPGETLTGIAAANGISVGSLAAYNGISPYTHVVSGTTVSIPSAPAVATSSGSPVDPNTIVSAPGMGHVPSPWGELHLAPAAADAWNAMRAESLGTTGTDVYPDGPLSAYRTYDQQAYLYDLYLSGQGAPANPPGTSSHESGDSVDVADPAMRSVVDRIGWKYGWTKVHAPGEWWHVDYVGG